MLVIVQDTVDGEVLDVLSVKNFDSDFFNRMRHAEYEWSYTTMAFDSFVYDKLRSYGYEFDVINSRSDWNVYSIGEV